MARKKGAGQASETSEPPKPAKVVEPVAAVAAEAQGGEAAAAAKKKKKRRPKKRAQAAAEASSEPHSDDSDADDVIVQPSSAGSVGAKHVASPGAFVNDGGRKLDPMALTVAECVRRGFSEKEVTAMVDEMWDQGKPYDNVDAVIAELHKKRGQVVDDFERVPPELLNQKHHHSQPKSPPRPTKPRSPPRPTKAQAHVPAPAPAKAVAAHAQPHSPPRPSAARAKSPVIKEPQHAPAPVVKSPKLAKVASPSRPTAAPVEPVPTLEERLELAASSENVVDSLQALIAFSSLVKNQSPEMRALFSSRTLNLLLRNVVGTSLAHPQDYPAVIKSKLETLLMQLLGTAAPLHDLLAVVAQAQRLNEQGTRPLSPIVIDGVATALADALKEYKRRVNTNQTVLSELSEIEARLSSKPGPGLGPASRAASLGTRELFVLRDAHVESVTLHENACKILVTSMTPVGPKSHELVRSSEKLLESILKDALDVSAEQLKAKRSQISSAKQELASTSKAMELELKPLIDESEACKGRLVELRVQKEELLRQLSRLENQIEAIEAQKSAAETAVQSRRQQFESSLAEKDRRLKGMLSTVRRADEAENLAKAVDALGLTLGQELGRTQSHNHDKLEGKLKLRLKAFAEAFEAYLDVETRCYEFLQSRVHRLEEERVGILRELNRYKTMGLESTGAQLAFKVSENDSFISEDKAVIASLREKAQAQYKTLRAALDQLGGPGGSWQVNEWLPIVPIKHGLDRLGLAKDWLPGLAPQHSPSRVQGASPPNTAPNVATDPVVPMPQPARPPPMRGGAPGPNVNGPSPIAPPPASASASASVASSTPAPPIPVPVPVPVAVAVAAPPVPETAAAPAAPAFKFSWANRATSTGSNVGAAEKKQKTLREIQAEELEGRLTEENLRRLGQGKQLGVTQSVEAEASLTDHTAGNGTAVSSEGVPGDGVMADDEDAVRGARVVMLDEADDNGLGLEEEA